MFADCSRLCMHTCSHRDYVYIRMCTCTCTCWSRSRKLRLVGTKCGSGPTVADHCRQNPVVPKTITVPQPKRLVQLGISYQTLQDIRFSPSTDTDFGKTFADRSTKPTSPRDARDRFVFVFLLPTNFSKSHHISKRNHQSAEMGYRPCDLRKFIKSTHVDI